MNKRQLATVVMLALSAATSAANAADNVSYDAAKKQAATRYAEDKKLCAEETSSGARMQCLRDAKEEYNKSLATAKESYNKGTSAPPAAKASAVCA